MTSFGAYEVIETIAVGSTGTVYRARHREIDRIAAVKELNPRMRAVPGMLDRFRAEAQLLATLDHEHIVAVYDFGEDPGRVWIAEEWVDGVSIAALLVASGQLTPEQSLGVLRGALLGLAHAHDRNLIHRDFAPSNILADLAGTSKLIDFGLAAPVGQGGVCGTPAFMSPEAARGVPVGKAGDVYSAAAVLFTLLSGRVPFTGSSAEAVLQAQISTPPPTLKDHGPALASLVADAMAKDPRARPPDARAFLTRLEQAAHERYGAAWLSRASIAGLVSAGAGAVAVGATSTGTLGAASSGAATPGSAATVFIDAKAATGAAQTVGRSSRKLIFGGVAAALAITAAVVAAAASSNDTTPEPRRTVNAAPITPRPATNPNLITKSVSPTKASVARFQYRSVITKIEGLSVDHVGQVFTAMWTFTSTCDAAGPCSTLVDTAGGKFALAATKTMTRSGTESIRCPRVDKPQALTFRQVLTIKRGPGGLPTALKGTGRQVSTGCDASPTITYYDLTVTPV